MFDFLQTGVCEWQSPMSMLWFFFHTGKFGICAQIGNFLEYRKSLPKQIVAISQETPLEELLRSRHMWLDSNLKSLKLNSMVRSSTNLYHKFIAAAKKSIYAALVQSSSKPRALWKTINKIYTELQIAPYPHHPLWLPYHNYLPHTSLIKSQSFISTYKPTPLPPQLILFHLLPLLYSILSLLSPYSKSTIFSLNHLIHTMISILFLPPY